MKNPMFRGPIEPEITLQDVYDEVESVDQKLDNIMNELAGITAAMKALTSSIADVQRSVDERD